MPEDSPSLRPLRPRSWARVPRGQWHRAAWQEFGQGVMVGYVALCGARLPIAGGLESSAARGAPGLGCGECAEIAVEQATGRPG